MKNLSGNRKCLHNLLIVVASFLCIGNNALAAEKEGVVDKSKLGLRPTVYSQLPFDLTKVESIDKANLSKDAKALLSKNGFVVVGPPHGSMPRCYGTKIMPLVTIDSVLEVFLSDFEIAWGALEDKQAKRFARLQVELWNALVARFERIPEGAARVAGQRLLGLAAVGRSLSDPGWTIPQKLPNGVDAAVLTAAWKIDLSLVRKHEGHSRSALWKREIYWSAFRPIGPYASSATLKNFYRTSQWWGRQGLRSAEREERLCAGILSWVLQDASPLDPAAKDEYGFPDDDARKGPLRILKQIKLTYDPFFGEPEDVTVFDLMYTRHDPKDADDLRVPQDFGTGKFDLWILDVFQFLKVPQTFHEWDISDATPSRRNGQGLRLLAPRTTRATKVFGRIIDPHVPGRLLPKALDLLAVLGDERAKELTLENEEIPEVRHKLDGQLKILRAEFRTDDKFVGHRMTFRNCLNRVYSTLANPRHDDRGPLFTRTPAYRDRGLTSALALWTGAREIYSIRVLSGGGIGGGSRDPTGIADPNLDGWQRLIELCHATSLAFGRSEIEFSPTAMNWALIYRRIAEKQLRGEPLSAGERYRFLHYFMKVDNAIQAKIMPEGDDDFSRVDRRVTVTFAWSRMPDMARYAGKACCRMYAVVEYQGRPYLCQGGVFDYCEFDRPLGSALSRKEFRKLMDSRQAPLPPKWTKSYRVNK